MYIIITELFRTLKIKLNHHFCLQKYASSCCFPLYFCDIVLSVNINILHMV